MNRFTLYKTLFLGCLAASPLSAFFPSVGTLITLLYFVATFFLVFTRESTPEAEIVEDVPEAHYYFRSRVNNFGFVMLIGFGISSMIYLVTSSYIVIPTVIPPLLAWLCMIGFSILAMRIAQNDFDKELTVNLLMERFNFDLRDAEDLFKLMDKSSNIDVFKTALLQRFPTIQENILEELSSIYLLATKKEKILSDEIAELNDNKRKDNK